MNVAGVAPRDGYAYVTFERDGKAIRKHVHVADGVPCGRAFFLVAHEADRDLAHALHGDDWRKHCEYTRDMPDEDLDRLCYKALEFLQQEGAAP